MHHLDTLVFIHFFKTTICTLVLPAGLHKTLAPHLRLRWESVQRQDGANDCGLFAIAFLVETLFGFNPAKV